MHRRQFTGLLGAALSAATLSGCAQNFLGKTSGQIDDELKAIESRSGGRLGVAVLDTGNGMFYGHRANERFPMASTFKFLAAAFVLQRVDTGQEKLERTIAVKASDLVEYSPAVQPRAGGAPMSMAELCAAAVTLSDNAAANLMLASFGGPAALTAYARSLGDSMTRLDRTEPTLNEATPGDVRDTTTPAAMVATMHKLVLGSALSEPSRNQLRQWLLANKTGDTRLRALLPAGWRVGDKTGTAAHGTANDIGVIWPPGRAPFVVSAYLTETSRPMDQRNAALAQVGQLLASGKI